MKLKLNELIAKVHAANKKWWHDLETGQPLARNKGELIALIHSEISEMSAGRREGLMDDKLPHRLMEEVECVDALIRALDYAGGFNYKMPDVFMSDCVLPRTISETWAVPTIELHEACSELLESERKSKPDAAEKVLALISKIYTYGVQNNYDMEGAFNEKMAFNAVRKDHTHEHRRSEHGKKF